MSLKVTKPKILLHVVAASILVVGTWLIEQVQQQYHKQVISNDQQEMLAEIALVRARLEAAINSVVYQIQGLATLITVNPDSTQQHWQTLAGEVMRNASHIRNISLAPDNVIQFMYPIEGNEEAIGFHYRSIPAQWKDVEAAINSGQMRLVGPINLVQGGQGFIARIPIFTDPPANQHYWGMVSTVIDVDSLYSLAELDRFPTWVNIALRTQKNPDSFYGHNYVFDNPDKTEVIRVPGNQWLLAVTFNPELMAVNHFESHYVRFLGYPLLAFLLLTFYGLLRLYYLSHRASLQDELTGLANRRQFYWKCEDTLNKARKQGSQFCILNLDLNHFKQINDHYGHAAGDAVLKEVAARLESSVRSADLVARVGGDEFLVLLTRLRHEADVDQVVRKIQLSLYSDKIHCAQGHFAVSASVGRACFPEDGETLEELLATADDNMFAHKTDYKYPQLIRIDGQPWPTEQGEKLPPILGQQE